MKKLVNFLYKTFTDVSGQPEAKLLTACLFAVIQAFFCVRGAICNAWPPEWLYNSNLLFVGALVGLDTTNSILNRSKNEQKVNA